MKNLHADQEFNNRLVRLLGEKYGFRVTWPSPYNPNANANVERFNKTLKQMINNWITDKDSKDFIEDLQDIVEAYNNSVNSVTGLTPNELYEADEETKEAVRTRLQERRDKMAEEMEPPYKVGQRVRIALCAFSEQRKIRNGLGQEF